MQKSSTTKRTQSSSRRKPAATKKAVRKPRVNKLEDPAAWELLWIRLRNGEEFVSLSHIDAGGVYLSDPMMITYLQGKLVFAPYGLMADQPGFYFAKETILHANPVKDSVRDLYFISLRSTMEYCEQEFEGLMAGSIDMVQRAIDRRTMKDAQEPTEADIERIESQMSELLGVPAEFASDKITRGRSDTIDNLVKLAEKAGKGKKLAKG